MTLEEHLGNPGGAAEIFPEAVDSEADVEDVLPIAKYRLESS